jgi:hypothetical protein
MEQVARQEAPWPYYTQRQAAKKLGVAVEYLQGLANNGVPAVKTAGNSGGQVYLFQREAVDELAVRIANAARRQAR